MAKPDDSTAGLPSGNAKYVVAALVLLVGIGVVAGFKFCTQPDQITIPSPPPPPRPAPTPEPSATVADLPPPVDAGVDAPRGAVLAVGGGGPVQSCASPCTGVAGGEMTNSVSARASQARGCYNQALLSDSTLKGSVNVAVRVGPTGAPCGGASVSNQMSSGAGAIVASCVQRIFSGAYPPPHGGCVDVSVPLSFSTR